MPRPIELWYWPTPNGWKVSIALEEMGLPYELKPVNIGAGEQFEPAFQAISPNGRMPAIVDPDGPDGLPLSIFESGAILQYLGHKSGRFYPRDARGKAEVIIAKQRHGPTGTVQLSFEAQFTRFGNLARADYLPERME